MNQEKPPISNQETTLDTYESGAQKYLERTPSEVVGEFKEFIDDTLKMVPLDAKILEIGSATGRDADYIESKGYEVLRTDIVDSFIEYQVEQGNDIVKYNAITGDLKHQFDLIYASAVFLHFNLEQFVQAVRNTANHIQEGGYFALTLKQGEGEEYSEEKMDNPRYFKFWTAEPLQEVLESEGFSIERLTESEDGKWLHCIAQKG